MSKMTRRLALLLFSIVFTLLGLLWILSLTTGYPVDVTRTPQQELEAVWERVRERGVYHFSADIVQTTLPLPKVTNIGRQSREDAYFLEGRTNLPQQQLDFTLWSEGGSITHNQGGVAVRVDSDQAMIRQGEGPWEPVDDFSGLFAPGGDFLSYLSAGRQVVRHQLESRMGVTFTRYTFELDGPAFAAYMRDQLEQQLRETGELPPSVSLDLPRQYADMTGQGELWVRKDGLPLRQILQLQFPEQEEERLEGHIDVSFSDFGPAPAQPWSHALKQRFLSVQSQRQVGLLALGLVLITLLLYYRHSKKLYAAVVLTVIASMVLTPCQFSGVNVPPVFGHDVPPVFGHDVPPLFGQMHHRLGWSNSLESLSLRAPISLRRETGALFLPDVTGNFQVGLNGQLRSMGLITSCLVTSISLLSETELLS